MFLKTHCTGGDIIVNILNRFADLRNLLVAIPSSGLSTLHWPNRFNWKYMDLMLLDGQLPNILASHTRFNSDVINEIMSPNAAFITILRNPVYNFRSTFEHFEYARIMSLENYTDPLMTFLNNPKVHIQRAIKEHRFTVRVLNLNRSAQTPYGYRAQGGQRSLITIMTGGSRDLRVYLELALHSFKNI